MWSLSTNVTGRQTRTDDMQSQDRALHYSASRGKNCSSGQRQNWKLCCVLFPESQWFYSSRWTHTRHGLVFSQLCFAASSLNWGTKGQRFVWHRSARRSSCIFLCSWLLTLCHKHTAIYTRFDLPLEAISVISHIKAWKYAASSHKHGSVRNNSMWLVTATRIQTANSIDSAVDNCVRYVF